VGGLTDTMDWAQLQKLKKETRDSKTLEALMLLEQVLIDTSELRGMSIDSLLRYYDEWEKKNGYHRHG
jgi:hypothetical protein